MKNFIAIFFIAINFFCYAGENENLLKNSSFEEWEDSKPSFWSGWITTAKSSDAIDGKYSLKLYNIKDSWTGFEQTVQLKKTKERFLTLKAYIKTKDVTTGPNEWDMARILILFFNSSNKQIGGWPELGRWKGSSPWAIKEKSFEIPEGAVNCKVQIILGTCRGEFWADNLELFYGKPGRISDSKNLLLNPGLEYGSDFPEDWTFWNDEESFFISPGCGKESKRAFLIRRTKPGYALLEQICELDGTVAKTINLECDVRLKNVKQGSQIWEKARFNVEFLDENKKQINGWPIVGEGIGTTEDWIHWKKILTVPPQTKYIKHTAGILNTTGEVIFDNFLSQPFDATGKIIQRKQVMKESRKEWSKFEPDFNQIEVWKDINLSFLLDPPAGKHGFAKSKDGKIVFEDGTFCRFWGVDIVGGNAFPEHKDATLMAKRLASIGCNMVRFHHLDAPWARPNIFGNNPDTTLILSKEMTDRLDFFIAELIKNGIYIYLDLLVHRKPAKDDGIKDWEDLPNGLKGIAHFQKSLIELQKDYAKKLLTRTNNYTKRRYCDEPAIVMTEIINESSLFYNDRQSDFPERYRKELDRLFNQWLLTIYKNRKNLASSWKEELKPEEDPEKGTVKRARFEIRWDDWLKNVFSKDGQKRQRDTKKFYFELQKAHYEEMKNFLRSIGFKGLITGSNHWERFDADILSNCIDHIDRHSYYDHPDTSRGWGLTEIRFQNKSVLKDEKNNIAELASSRVSNLPFIVTEWNIPLNNEYRTAGPVMMAAYSTFQDWDGLLQFPFNNPRWSKVMTDTFDISAMPSVLCQWVPAAVLFHKGYIKKGDSVFSETIGNSILFEDPDTAYRVIGNNLLTPLIFRISKKISTNANESFQDITPLIKKYITEEGVINETGELIWNLKKGLLKINSPFIQGFAGESGKEILEFDDIKLKIDTPFCAVFLISMDGQPLSISKKMILATSARDENSEWEYNNTKTQFIDSGTSPIIIEPVTGEIIFKKRKNLSVKESDNNGYLKPAGKIEKEGVAFKLTGQKFFREFSTLP